MSNIQPAPTIEDKDVVEVHECPNQDDLCHKVDNSGHRANDSGHRAADSSHRAANSGHRADDSGHRADDSGHRAHDFGHRGNSPGERCNKPGLKQDENGREENESPGDVTKGRMATVADLYDNLSELDGEAEREKGKVMDDMMNQLDNIGRQITDRFVNRATVGAYYPPSNPGNLHER
ncbi:hypothetical protein TCAL_16890 [Tigriopus californicus]|uniref:Uncharacterized protein n=1 Tax=Tigriopus californicus TaxID=6832 RepID=A0A553P7W3_TIGCA|nr:hypothetical protein TCAL_16890 [Tigriopus californicus]